MDQEKSEALKTFWLTKDRTPFPELTSTASVKKTFESQWKFGNKLHIWQSQKFDNPTIYNKSEINK
jgi:hypothetical protein